MKHFNLLALVLIGSVLLGARNFMESAPVSITDYSILGTGPDTLLLIPCMSCRWNEWEEFMQRNQERYTMYAITVPGFGGTPVPELPTDNYLEPIWRDHLMQAISSFVDKEGLQGAIAVGHSWGTQLAIQIASIRPDVFRKVVAVDGGIESSSMIPGNEEERIRQMKEIEVYVESLAADPEAWRRFNGVTYRYNGDSLREEDVKWALKLHGSFMATSRIALVQYWRENLVVDLDAHLLGLKIPVLNIQSFVGQGQEEQKEKHFQELRVVGNPENVRTIVLYDTYHFIMQHRPQTLDQCISSFINDEILPDEFRF